VAWYNDLIRGLGDVAGIIPGVGQYVEKGADALAGVIPGDDEDEEEREPERPGPQFIPMEAPEPMRFGGRAASMNVRPPDVRWDALRRMQTGGERWRNQ